MTDISRRESGFENNRELRPILMSALTKRGCKLENLKEKEDELKRQSIDRF